MDSRVNECENVFTNYVTYAGLQVENSDNWEKV
jgi:hypothetical protein